MKFIHREPGIQLDDRDSSKRIKAEMLRRGCRETAKQVGVSPTTVSLWAMGKTILPWSTAMKIMTALHMAESLWTCTLYDRIIYAERLGFDFSGPGGMAEAKEKPETNQ